MSRIKVFFCEETDRVTFDFRVYESGECPGPGGRFHNAHSERIDEYRQAPRTELAEERPRLEDFAGDARWPVKCDHCDHAFGEAAERQIWQKRVLRRSDTGAEIEGGYRAVPPGGIWDAWWMADALHGDDGRCLICKLPDGHDWMIDSRASNCTLPQDQVHRCWVRHGKPEDGSLHVDKNGVTCAAGAGSIATPKWHGFLHHGELYPC